MSDNELLDLLILRDARITVGDRHEALVLVVHQAILAKKGEFTNRSIGQQWPEANVCQLDKPIPRRRPTVELQSVIPQFTPGIQDYTIFWVG
jgi:hypothetical protein